LIFPIFLTKPSMEHNMNPIQLFDPQSSTYTYILFDETSREAVIIDPVDEQLERDLSVLKEHQLNLIWIIETHAHADHVTSAWRLAEHTGAKTAAPEHCQIRSATRQLSDRDTLSFGQESLTARHTPGHTAGSMSYLWRHCVFTGDTLLINGCGRTDFQSGSAADLYQSITEKLFTLPNETAVYPGHDYNGAKHSSIGDEKAHNPRLAGKTAAQFIDIMSNLNLPQPKRIHEAVPANLRLGIRHDAGGSPIVNAPEGYAGDISPHTAHQWWTEGIAQLIDVRTQAEREWVGFIPDAQVIAWQEWPSMTVNPAFDDALMTNSTKSTTVIFFCRSGVRAIAAARRATELGYTAYNIIGGFEGELDDNAHRGNINGWQAAKLRWRQK
jgi:glyoxylase-like metal-dependent hydrolase (beta-lactamase superfamily II)/rhodanese-related sulfurtransferase